jgi:hypothetical protein
MKHSMVVLAFLAVPLMLFLTVAQSARHHTLLVEVRALEGLQADWIEENRRLVSNIAVASARYRIEASLADAPGYRMVRPNTTLRIQVVPGMEKRDG